MIYIIAIVIPILVIGTFLVTNTFKLLLNYNRDLIESDNLRVKTMLFEITSQIYNISEDIAFNWELQNILTSHGETEEEIRIATLFAEESADFEPRAEIRNIYT